MTERRKRKACNPAKMSRPKCPGSDSAILPANKQMYEYAADMIEPPSGPATLAPGCGHPQAESDEVRGGFLVCKLFDGLKEMSSLPIREQDSYSFIFLFVSDLFVTMFVSFFYGRRRHAISRVFLSN